MTTGERIKLLRINRDMSQEALGASVGVKKAAINKYESGVVVNIKRSTIERLAHTLDTTAAYLMGWTEDPTPHTSLLGMVADDNGLHGASAAIKDATAPKPHPLVEIYETLNEEGKEKLLDYADDLAQSGKYKK